MMMEALPKCIGLLFLVAVLGQSGLDKVFNYRGNLQYFQEQFKTSPLSGMVGALFPAILLMEVGTAILSLAGLLVLLNSADGRIGAYACTLGCLNFIALIFGQRMAKDYAGAAGIVPYLAVALLGLFAFH